MDVDRVQHGVPAVGERDVVDVQVAVDPRQPSCIGRVADLRLDVEDEADLLHRRAR